MRILLADSSEEFRRSLDETIAAQPEDRLVGWARNGNDVLPMIQEKKPDVVILDMFLPPYDGFFVLDRIMMSHPVPIIMLCSLPCPFDSELFKEAAERGARAIFPKPDNSARLKALSPKLKEAMDSCMNASRDGLLADYLVRKSQILGRGEGRPAARAVGIIGSTGAVEVLRQLLSRLPKKFEGSVLVAQHMYAPVWKQFTAVLSQVLPYRITMAHGGEILREGAAFLSPTDLTLMCTKTHFGGVTRLEKETQFLVGQVPLQPNLDAFFTSLAACYGMNTIGIVLSGIGESGIMGAKAIRDAGGQVWAQSPETAVVSSMPQAVIKSGVANKVLSAGEMNAALSVIL